MNLIDFRKALEDHKFKPVGPNTYIHADLTDVITVFIHPHTVIVTADGPHVIPSWNLFPVFDSGENGPWVTNGWDELYQVVLSKF